MYRPLADELRPTTLENVVGQGHILGQNGVLRRIIESGKIPNMIFYGPSGTGKTTVASIVAEKTNRTLRKLNATTSGIADIKAIIDEVDTLLAPEGILLYLEEIQYFNKKQQQSLLEFIENGKITLIASTTENRISMFTTRFLSRSTVFEFKQVAAKEAVPAVERAISFMETREGVSAKAEKGVVEHIARACGGDIRKAVNSVEILFSTGRRKGGAISLSLADAKEVSQKSAMRYDRAGDEHYDILSALQKSIRGSEPRRRAPLSGQAA
jgi:putative ATPase